MHDIAVTPIETSRLMVWLPVDASDATCAALLKHACDRGIAAARHGVITCCWDGPAQPAGMANHGGPLEFRHVLPNRSTLPTTDGQLFNRLRLDLDCMECESDPLGLVSMYVAHTCTGVLLASHLSDLLSVRPELSRPYDPQGLPAMLAFGVPLGDRTIHAQVQRLPLGRTIQWSHREGWSTHTGRQIAPQPPDGSISVAARCDHLLDLLRTSVQTCLPDRTEPVTLPLSGGFDSRLLAAVLTEMGYRVAPCTYGDPHHREVQMALRTARVLHLKPQRILYSEDRLDPWASPVYLDCIEGEADPALLQITHLLGLPAEAPPTLVHGFLGGTLGGANLDWLKSVDLVSHDAVAEGISRHLLRHYRVDDTVAKSLGLDISGLAAAIRSQLRDDTLPYQSLMLWDLGVRQRRYIAMHLALLSSRYHVVAPFNSPQLIEAWLSQPYELLRDRALYRQLLAGAFPRLAAIPHSEEQTAILPSWRERVVEPMATKVAREMRWVGSRLPGIGEWMRMKRQKRPNSDIWAVTYGMPEPRRQVMVTRIDAHRATLHERLGLDLTCADVAQLRDQPTALRNLDAVTAFVAALEKVPTAA